MLNTQTLSLEVLHVDPRNPRKEYCEQAQRGLAENLLSLGQQVPLIVTPLPDGGFQIIDGHRRYYAAKLAGIPELTCVVMSMAYSEADLRLTQLSVEAHKVALTSMERSELLARIKAETKWSVTELAKAVGIDQATATKLLSLQRLDPELKTLVHTGGLKLEEAYFISREPDVEKQRELARAAPGLNREQLRQRVKPDGKKREDEVRADKAVFALQTGSLVTVQGKALSIPTAIEALTELIRDLKRAFAENLNIKTAQQVFKDRARAAPAT